YPTSAARRCLERPESKSCSSHEQHRSASHARQATCSRRTFWGRGTLEEPAQGFVGVRMVLASRPVGARRVGKKPHSRCATWWSRVLLGWLVAVHDSVNFLSR